MMEEEEEEGRNDDDAKAEEKKKKDKWRRWKSNKSIDTKDHEFNPKIRKSFHLQMMGR